MKDRTIFIHRYLDGELSDAEKVSFEQEMSGNDELRAEVEDYRLIRSALENNTIQEVAAEVSAFDTPKRTSLNIYLMMAATVAVICVAAIVLSTRDTTVDYDTIFQPYPDITMVRGGESNAFQMAMETYNEGDFAQAAGSLATLSPDEDTVSFYLGNAYLFAGQPENAIPVYKSVISSNSVFSEEARWYLVKALLDKGDQNAAINQLEQVRDAAGSNHREEAAELLDELR